MYTHFTFSKINILLTLNKFLIDSGSGGGGVKPHQPKISDNFLLLLRRGIIMK